MTCATCHRPLSRGSTRGERPANTRCVVCQTAEALKAWRYPASQDKQRMLRKQKERAR